jgi:hypothetical protein
MERDLPRVNVTDNNPPGMKRHMQKEASSPKQTEPSQAGDTCQEGMGSWTELLSFSLGIAQTSFSQIMRKPLSSIYFFNF